MRCLPNWAACVGFIGAHFEKPRRTNISRGESVLRNIVLFAVSILSLNAATTVTASNPEIQLRVSIPEQKLYVFDAGRKVTTFRVSTSAFGLGDAKGSYSTPLGHLKIASKVGAGAPAGTVFKGRCRTGEVCAVNAKGRDPIVTRILHLQGLEKQNARAYGRGIYIHGTPEERRIGRPASYGCVRMKSKDIIKLYDMVVVGTQVEITTDRIGGGLFSFVKRSVGARPKVATKLK
jgi:hypothetical protein